MSRLVKVRVAGYKAGISVESSPDRNAPAIVALHGFTGCGRDFRSVREALGVRAAHWICPDFMGHGLSDAPQNLDPYLLPATIRLIEQARSLAPNPDRVVLLAYSMGARLALQYLMRAKPLPAILIGSSPGLATERERANRRKADLKWIHLLSGSDGMEAFANAWERQSLIAPQTRLPQPLCAELAKRRRVNRPTGLIQSLLATGTGALPSLWNRLEQLQPLKLAFGSADRKFGQVAAKMANVNPHLQVLEVPGAGHAPHLEQPALVAQFLEEELAPFSTT